LGGRPRLYDDVTPLLEHPSVQKWMEGLREGPNQRTALYNLARYLRWRKARGLEADPEKLIEECLNGTNLTLVQHLNPLVQYCQGPTFEGSVRETRRKNFRDVVSFYRSHFVTLPRAKISGSIEHKVGTEITATKFLHFAKTVLLKARLTTRARAIVLTMVQSGMDASTLMDVFNYYGYPQIAAHFGTAQHEEWDSSKCPVRVDLVRPKTNFRYYTFLDVDSIESLKDWLVERKSMTGGGPAIQTGQGSSKMPKSDPIFITRDGRPMTPKSVGEVFRESGKRAGVNIVPGTKTADYKWASNRYLFHSHEVRDTLITISRRVKADVVAANFFVGHSIDKLGYDKSPWDSEDYFRAEYMKVARPHLNIVSNFQVSPSTSKDLEGRIQQLEDLVRSLLAKPTSSTPGAAQASALGLSV